ncbi:hypothetical protein CDD82_5299 [Ophiocordyceps australis]|uniref:Uncharacterized protein n=1 Tax=Ophiocordyceps australis TaxID=1399860 RepID=A0A2C5Z3I6_9HYPO|nr:hypothetical protein CDD82_5299 [Ophiocordyceps australis]
MADKTQPKVLLFDIGGVCVGSPFQAILDYELSLGIPPGWINFSISKSGPLGFWQRLERGDIPLDAAFFAGFQKDLHDAALWKAFYQREQAKNPSLAVQLPPLPRLDVQRLFDQMMDAALVLDPWMYPALQKLKQSGRYILAALSNTIIFPPGHRLHRPDSQNDPLRQLFDLFISSAHVHVRKPDPRIYQIAVEKLDSFATHHALSQRGKLCDWQNGITSSDILFLDDIGQNLKGARNQGFRVIKVNLGRAYEAVEELERVTGLHLQGPHPKVPFKPHASMPRVKL